jgi:FkbM family methyltransferase
MNFSIIKKILPAIKKTFPTLLNFVNSILKLVGYKLILGPYSGYNLSVFILYKKKYLQRFKSINNSLVGKAKFFNFNIFHQIYDRRAVFFNQWDHESTLVATLALASKAFEDKDIYDLGANYGIFSLPYIKDTSVKNHILVEANPFLTTCLNKTFNDGQIILNNAITSELNSKNKFVNLNVIPGGSGSSSMDSEINVSHPFFSYALDVRSIDPTFLFKNYKQSNNALIKIDIEKQELNLLRNGFLDTIKEYYKDYIILIEFLISDTDNSINEEFCKYFRDYPIILFGPHNWKNSIRKITKNDFLDGRNLNLNDFYDLCLSKGISLDLNKNDYVEILLFSNESLASKFLKNCKLPSTSDFTNK